ncbi:7439_t:CDS:2 [Funneliformis mosseae]|uniref:7439_t:CDS:1 n=1 Tax=Funneliformis mosseae TaxID=27381 RepID=A0A9N8Z492_FUNMO|nr:7439_t:CDS:2 [Funneliformis mosseae]
MIRLITDRRLTQRIIADSLNVIPIATSGDVPKARSLHTHINTGTSLFVFGGKFDNPEDKLDGNIYMLDIGSKYIWSKPTITGNLPAGRYGHTSTAIGTKIYIFGGRNDEKYLNDLISFDFKSFKSIKKKSKLKFTLGKGNNNSSEWNFIVPANSPPPARSGHISCNCDDKIYIFGGSDGEKYYNDTWCYDIKENTWTELSCTGYIPAPRELHSATIINDVIYSFGGRTKEGNVIKELGDLCAFRISNLRWYKFPNLGPSPSPRYSLNMTASHDKICVFGGDCSQPPKIDEDGIIHILDTYRGPSAIVSPPPTSQPKVITSKIITQTGRETSFPQRPTSPSKGKALENVQFFQQEYSPTDSEISSYELQTINVAQLQQQQEYLSSREIIRKNFIDKIDKGDLNNNNLTGYNNKSSLPLPIKSKINISAWANPIQDMSIKRDFFEVQNSIPEDSIMTTNENPNRRIFLDNQLRISHRRTNSQELSISSTPRALAPRRISVDNRPTPHELSLGPSHRQFPIRRASADNYKTTKQITGFPSGRTSCDNQRTITTIIESPSRATFADDTKLITSTIKSPSKITVNNQKTTLIDNQRTITPIMESPSNKILVDKESTVTPIMESLSNSTLVDKEKTITPITESPSNTTIVDNQKSITESPSNPNTTFIDNERIITPITEPPSQTPVVETSSTTTLVDNERTITPIVESPTETTWTTLVGNQRTTMQATEVNSLKISVDNQIIGSHFGEHPSTISVESQKTTQTTEMPSRQISHDSKMDLPIIGFPSTTIASINNTPNIIPTSRASALPVSSVISEQKELVTSEATRNTTIDVSENKTEKVKNIPSKRNNSSTTTIYKSDKRSSSDSLTSSSSNQSNHSLSSRRNGKETRPRGARPMGASRPNNSSPLHMRTDSDQLNRDSLIKLQESLTHSPSNGINTPDNSSVASLRSGNSVYNDDESTRVRSSSQPKSSNSSISDVKPNNDSGNEKSQHESESDGSVYENEDIMTTSSNTNDSFIIQTSKLDVTEDVSDIPHLKMDDENLKQEFEQHQSNIKEFKQRESWFKAELDSARKSGFTPDLYDDGNKEDGGATEEVEKMLINEDDDEVYNAEQRRVMESIIQIQQRLLKAKAKISNQAQVVSQKLSSTERARSAAVHEATYFRTKLDTLVKLSESKFSNVELGQTKELEKQLIKTLTENKMLEDQYLEFYQSSNLEKSTKKSVNDQIQIDISRAESAEKARERVLAKLAALRLKAATSESQLEKSNKQLEKVNNEIELFRKEKSNDRVKINNLHSNLEHHHQVFEQVSNAVLIANERAEEAEKLWKQSRNDIFKLEKEVVGLKMELENKTRELDHAVDRVDEVERLLGKVQKEGSVVRNLMQEGMTELLNISWWDKVSNSVWENAKIRRLEEELALLKSSKDDDNYLKLYE